MINVSFSDWRMICRGVPQGLVLGPLLFLMYINDSDCGVQSMISKFVNDTKIGNVTTCDEDSLELQKDIDILVNWADKWQMKFNAKNCEMILAGRM